MSQGFDVPQAVLTRRQAYGCLGLAGFSLGVAGLCVALGIMCMAKHGVFDCVGLLSLFPLAFLGIGLIAGAVGLQRFTSSGRKPEPPAAPAAAGWQPVSTSPRRRLLPDVIYLPGHAEEPRNSATGIDDEMEQA